MLKSGQSGKAEKLLVSGRPSVAGFDNFTQAAPIGGVVSKEIGALAQNKDLWRAERGAQSLVQCHNGLALARICAGLLDHILDYAKHPGFAGRIGITLLAYDQQHIARLKIQTGALQHQPLLPVQRKSGLHGLWFQRVPLRGGLRWLRSFQTSAAFRPGLADSALSPPWEWSPTWERRPRFPA